MRKAISRDTRETLCLAKIKSAFLNSLHTLYIPSLPTKLWGVLSREKALATHLRVRDCYTHNHLHKFSWFFLYSYLSIFISLSGSQPKHLSHPIWELSEVLVCVGSIGRSHWVADAIKRNCEIRITSEDKTLRSPLVAGAWKAQIHYVD